MRGRVVAAAGATIAALLLAGCSGPSAASRLRPTAPASTPDAPSPSVGTAGAVAVRALLDGLRVAPETRGTGYDRERFGYGGDLDPDHDGCWTRREVLIRDSVVRPTVGRRCAVTGEWRSPLDGVTTRDQDRLTIDHTVPLLEAWRSGADAWTDRRLVAYGNDLGYEWSLQATTQAVNEDKGDSDPAGWLPPVDRCHYVAGWIAVKARWDLTVDQRERAALLRVLAGCGDLRVESPRVPDIAALTGEH